MKQVNDESISPGKWSNRGDLACAYVLVLWMVCFIERCQLWNLILKTRKTKGTPDGMGDAF